MTMSGRVTSCCVALLLTLTSVSSVKWLNSINELIQNDPSLYGQIFALLEWFATTADINDNGIRLTFDPEGGDYGSHYYSNFEGLLEQRGFGQRDYTLGNINQDINQESRSSNHLELPLNVVNNRRNSVRIIVRIRDVYQGRQAQRIDRVYITQHNGSRDDGKRYDPGHTYEISTNFLRQMRNMQWTNSISREQSARHTRYDPGHTYEFSGQLRDNLRSHLSYREQSAGHTSHLQSYDYRHHHQENQWSAMDALMIVCVSILLLCIIVYFLVHSEQPKRRWL